MENDEKKILEENKKIYERFLYELYNEGKLDVADEIMAEDYEYHDVIFKDLPFHTSGPAGIKQRVQLYKAGIPDLYFESVFMVAEGDKVVCYWKGKGTHTGRIFGIKGTGNKLDFKGIDILRIVDGKIVEGWDCSDFLTAFRQVGAIKLPWEKS
ncbi:MAG: ester cyclase [Candidatus Hermodarchaeota archaeon]